MKQILIIFLFAFTLQACNNHNVEIILDNYIAKGNIKDSIFNGVIRFYDKKTNALKIESVYKNDTLNGWQKEYYDNGRLNLYSNYSDGKLNGYSSMFDSLGNPVYKTFFYYDMRAGHSLVYKNGKLQEYYFYGIGVKDYYHINYDSIGSMGILDLQNDNFFFIHSTPLADSNYIYWLGDVNPPRYNFKYYLVRVNEKNIVQDTIKNLRLNTELWYKFTVNNKLFSNPKSIPAIMISVIDSINGFNCSMIKKI